MGRVRMNAKHSKRLLFLSIHRRLTSEHWYWINLKISLIVWVIIIIIYTPKFFGEVVGSVMYVAMPITILGALISVYGLVTSVRSGRDVYGMSIELSGLWFMLAGPLV